MKKLTLALLFLISGRITFAQNTEGNDLKNFRFGLKVAPVVSWLRPDDPKKLENGGAKLKFAYGLVMEFRLSKIISFATGLEFNYDGGTLNYKDSAFYLVNKDDIMLLKDGAYPKTNTNNGVGKTYMQYQLKSRSYNLSYVTIPLTLKMKTKEINMLTYYGMFGFNVGVRTRCRVNDDLAPQATGFDPQNNDITKDMGLIKLGLNVGGGAEWNLAGSTSLVFGLNYYRGFVNALQGESNHLKNTALFNPMSAVKQTAYLDGLALTLGVLF